MLLYVWLAHDCNCLNKFKIIRLFHEGMQNIITVILYFHVVWHKTPNKKKRPAILVRQNIYSLVWKNSLWRRVRCNEFKRSKIKLGSGFTNSIKKQVKQFEGTN